MNIIRGILDPFFYGILLMLGLITGIFLWFKILIVLDWIMVDLKKYLKLYRIKIRRYFKKK